MKTSTVIQALIIVVFGFMAFLALYLRHPPSSPTPVVQKPAESVSKNEPAGAFVVPVDLKKPILIGVLGESRGDEEKNEAFNTKILKQLLYALKKKQVEALFFTGNLVSGKVKQKSDKQTISNPQVLTNQLKEFSHILDGYLGAKIPFFPITGDHELAVTDGPQIFKEAFHLKSSLPFEGDAFGYTVEIGPAFFAVISTDAYDANHENIQTSFSPAMLNWLKHTLQEAKKTHQYLFVVGHEPAFTSKSVLQKEPDAQIQMRDDFWKVLTDNGVLVYFASHEHLFDRSNRHGVWQVISGGGGAPLNAKEGDSPFYHALLLTIPMNSKEGPRIEVLDIKGEVVEEFDLKAQGLLYQFRISRNEREAVKKLSLFFLGLRHIPGKQNVI